MSLNGLDASAVTQAYQSTLADPGGWFLLKYVNRDTVELLGHGNGGVAEAKGAVDRYEEKSPLYGMLQYRRKRVLLKYVPEGTSRLLQVRLTVQFQSILDAFVHDTIFSFTSATELVESSLGLCTMLQPANGGSLKSSSSSIKQRRLNEISEDAEDLDIPVRREETIVVPPETERDNRILDQTETSTLPASALRAKALLAKRREENRVASKSSVDLVQQPASVSAPLLSEPVPVVSEPSRPMSSLSQLKARDEAEPKPYTPRTDSLLSAEQSRRNYHSRHLSQNESESISQWNAQVAAYTLPTPLPKKKLAPRPHVEPDTRPKTANQYENVTATRPVANLPTSVRVSNRMSSIGTNRPGSQQSSRSAPSRFIPPAGPVPPLPEFNHLQPFYKRPESHKAGSIASSTMTDNPTVSPEKLRLMKALQKRKRDQVLAQRATSAQPVLTSHDDGFPMGVHKLTQPPTTNTLPAAIQEEVPPPIQSVKSAKDSSTTSPTSVAAVSEEPSTRPSSLTDDRESGSSQKSISIDTNSSSTPKAVPSNSRPATKKHTSWYDSAPDLQGDDPVPVPPLPVEMPIDEPSMRIRDFRTPTLDMHFIEEPRPRQHDRSALSWLASDSQLDMVQSLVQAAEATSEDAGRERKPSNLSLPIEPSTENSSVQSDDDETLDEELHDATVHEAKPMSVSRPPLTPTMRTLSIDRTRAGTASTSNSSITPKSSRSLPSIPDKSPGQSLRSLSTALPQWPPGSDDEPMAVPLTKKSTLGDGISKRIKALEDSSRRDSSIASTTPTRESEMSRSTFSNLMKRTSFISQFQEKPQVKEVPKSTPSITPVATKSTITRPNSQRQGSSNDMFKARSNADSYLASGRTSGTNITEHERHESETAQVSMLPEPNGTRFESPYSSPDKKRFSFASYRSGSSAKWANSESMASRLSVATKDAKMSKPVSEVASINEEKRTSRTSRLMKRISGFGGRSNSKDQQIAKARQENRPDPIMEQTETPNHTESVASSSMQMIDIGDVNVQFPETLLWKRRFLRIDDQGYLIFTAPTESQTVRAMNRKFHLGDIQEPCLPDSEREEMAWSVLLDLRDGNCIQCACESKQGQSQVLKLLLDAHSAYHSLYPDALD